MADSTLAVAAAIWGMVMALSPLLQLRRMLRLRSSRDVSVGYFGLLIPGFALWMLYGLSIDNLVVAVPNLVALLVHLTTVGVVLVLRRTQRVGHERDPLSSIR